MQVLTPKLQTKNLRRAQNDADYRLYLAAHEWELVEPILIKETWGQTGRNTSLHGKPGTDGTLH
jgi:hypothetical protein